MEYLFIFLAVAGTGIAWLWLHQRRQRVRIQSVNGFRDSLRRISSHAVTVGVDPTSDARTPLVRPGRRRLEPLDPMRREAARRRLEARRAVRS